MHLSKFKTLRNIVLKSTNDLGICVFHSKTQADSSLLSPRDMPFPFKPFKIHISSPSFMGLFSFLLTII